MMDKIVKLIDTMHMSERYKYDRVSARSLWCSVIKDLNLILEEEECRVKGMAFKKRLLGT